MSHVRCFAHAAVTAVALVSWGASGWLLVLQPGPSHDLRLPFFTVLSIAIVSTVLALFPVVVFAYIKRHTTLLESTTALEAAWNLGCASGIRKERRRQEALHQPLRAVRGH